MCRISKKKNKAIRNTENEETEKNSTNNMKNYNLKYNFDYSSSADNCVAARTDDDYHKITPLNFKLQVGNNHNGNRKLVFHRGEGHSKADLKQFRRTKVVDGDKD